MLLRSDPFRDLDALAQEAFGTRMRPSAVPMDAYRHGDTFTVRFDLPGVEPDSIDLTVEKDVLTVAAERSWTIDDDTQVVASERRQGAYRRQLFLGKGLDADKVTADYTNGVLTVTIPVAEQAKPRKVAVTSGGGSPAIETTAA
jgi:HSP20 family protein